MGMKYALTAAVTIVVVLLIIVGGLLLKLGHGEYSCQFHGAFNETVVAVPQSAVTQDYDEEGGEVPPKTRHHKKALPVTTPTAGISLDGPPTTPVVTPAK